MEMKNEKLFSAKNDQICHVQCPKNEFWLASSFVVATVTVDAT